MSARNLVTKSAVPPLPEAVPEAAKRITSSIAPGDSEIPRSAHVDLNRRQNSSSPAPIGLFAVISESERSPITTGTRRLVRQEAFNWRITEIASVGRAAFEDNKSTFVGNTGVRT